MTAQWSLLRLPDGPASLPRIDSELARLVSANPTLRSLASTAKVSEADIDIARQERKPVFSVGADSRIYSGGRYRESTIGTKMSLPWFNRRVYQANIERARQQQSAAQGEYEALERKLRGEAIGAYTDAENAARQAETFTKEVIPRLESAARATESAWVSAKATLIEVLDAQRALLAARLEQRRAVAQQYAILETLRSIIPPSTPEK
jgi:cobalt-zinc-cadmium efflux system outer membrane protein